MYEIWLVLNIVWEIALGVWSLLVGGALLWLALMGMAWRATSARWSEGFMPALLSGVVVAVAALIVLPGALHSTLSDMGYWVDWAALLGLATAVGGAVAAFAWPLLVWRRSRVQA
ncbi:hypothetical protein MCEMSEM18_02601 [Comamonadaceae bacterium]